MTFTIEALTVIAALCSAPQYPQIQYTCERVTIHCIANSKPEKEGMMGIVTSNLIARCFTEDRGK